MSNQNERTRKIKCMENKLTYFCENCKSNTTIDAELFTLVKFDSEESADKARIAVKFPYYIIEMKCAKCGDEMVHIDTDIADVIKDLNLLGYTTTACCSGHPEIGDYTPYVMFGYYMYGLHVPKTGARMHADAIYRDAVAIKNVIEECMEQMDITMQCRNITVRMMEDVSSIEKDPRVIIEYSPNVDNIQRMKQQLEQDVMAFRKMLFDLCEMLPDRSSVFNLTDHVDMSGDGVLYDEVFDR